MLMLFCWGCVQAKEKPGASDLNGLSIELISDHSVIKSGQPFLVGFHVKHEEGYHTYWKNPGLVGLATNLEWKLPKGYRVSDLKWPHPKVSSMAGNPCYGYERDVTLFVVITPPKEITAKKVKISVEAMWMCCAESCFPGNGAFSLDLEVGEQAVKNDIHEGLFELAEKQLPDSNTALNTKLLSISKDQTISLAVSAPLPEKLDEVYLFSEDGQISSADGQAIEEQSNGLWVITVKRCKFSPEKVTSLPAVLKLGDQYYQINPDYIK